MLWLILLILLFPTLGEIAAFLFAAAVVVGIPIILGLMIYAFSVHSL